MILTNISAILVTPYMLRSLGKSEYGLYALIGAVVGYLAVLEFGLSYSIIRYVARYRARKDKEGEQNFLALAMITYVGISLLVFLAGAIIYWNLGNIFGASFTVAELSEARIMSAILVFNLAFLLPAGAFDAILTGYQRFSFLRSTELIRFVLRTALLILLLYLGYKAVSIIVLDTSMNILFSLLKCIYVFVRLRVRFKIHRFDKELIYEVFSSSFWIGCAVVLSQLYLRVGQTVLGITDGTASVAVFSISMIFLGYYVSSGLIISNVLLPHSVEVVERGASSSQLTDLMIKVGRIQFLIASYVLGGFLLFGHPFIRFWAGDGYSDAWLNAAIVMIPSTLMMTRNIGDNIMAALNRFVYRVIYLLVMVVASIAIGLIARHYVAGPFAMGIGMMAANFIGSVFMHFYLARVANIDMLRFYREVFFAQFVPMSVVYASSGLMIYFFPVTGWGSLAVEGALYSFIFGAATWYGGTNAYEKSLFIDGLASLKRFRKTVSAFEQY